jgi:ADP-ribose pyrophosphatase
MSFEQLSSQTVYEGRVFKIVVDQVRLPGGQVMQVDMVEHHGSVTILPIDSTGRIWFIRQYRHPAREMLLELPAGVSDKDETPEESAQRELREETGMAAGSLEHLGEFYLAPGYSNEYMHVFLAQDLIPAPLQPDEDEFLHIEKIPYQRVVEMIKTGQIIDAKSLAALLLGLDYLKELSG